MNRQNLPFNLPLFHFFEQLKKMDTRLGHKTLGFDVYIEVLEIIGNGYGLQSKRDLLKICQLMWLKPYHDQDEFERLFNSIFKIEQKTEDKNLKKKKRKKKLQDEPKVDPFNKENPTITSPETTNDKEQTTGSEKQLKKSIQKTVSLSFKSKTIGQSDFLPTDFDQIEKDIYSKIFRLRGRYSTLSPRKVEQGLRSLRIEEDLYNKKFLDLEAMIEQVTQRGYIYELIYSYGKKTFSKVNLLIDQGGSMVGFFPTVELLKEKVKAVNPEKISNYYFLNCPVGNVYKDKEITEAISLANLSQKKDTAIIILSDGGAARGRYDKGRVKDVKKFIQQMKNMPIVWINPVPKFRWKNTTAQFIAEIVPMFEATDIAFVNAIKKLKC